MKRITAGILGATILLGGGLISQAGTTWISETVDVPSHNRSGYTKTQQKVTSAADAGIQMNATNATTPDVRTTGPQGNGAWVRNVKGGTTASLPSRTTAGNYERLQISSDLLEGQSITAILNWRSN